MADFCLKCFNAINKENKTEDDVVMQWDFCERCNNLFGTNIKVDFSSVWKDRQVKEKTKENEIEKEKGADENV